jgi:hypothetical protein
MHQKESVVMSSESQEPKWEILPEGTSFLGWVIVIAVCIFLPPLAFCMAGLSYFNYHSKLTAWRTAQALKVAISEGEEWVEQDREIVEDEDESN